MAAGLTDELFWRLTPRELVSSLIAINRRQSLIEKAANMRAGLVAAEVRNTMRQKKSDKVWRTQDFFRGERKRLSVEESEAEMDLLMARINRKHRA